MLKSQHETGISSPVSIGRYDTHSWTRIKRLSKGTLLVLVSFGISLIALKYLCVPLLDYAYPDSHTFLLDNGIYGA